MYVNIRLLYTAILLFAFSTSASGLIRFRLRISHFHQAIIYTVIKYDDVALHHVKYCHNNIM